ncbi:hypothetical protein [Flavobacterium sp. SORGH_AS_0622]|uniref:hypothetical protein n=1 Tax=Flavobacterium sp. SORGH_AS_0622 TaxID=3041772 RepID=UPI002785C173|nr:hypothetical protein [Flavobacterium sp. SORGH_AS_0622]MDQ1165897.1 hypothetical protein [Flavobacterium sp. SORGH_AS_0622]
MKTDVEKAVEVDAYVLKASGLIKDKRSYNALMNLLQTGVLMNERLGEDDTVVLCKILIVMKFSYEFIPYGVRLKENSKLDFYNKVMYPPKVEYRNYSDNVLRVGKEERSTRHWAQDILANKEDSK